MESFNWDTAKTICELNGFKYLLGSESPKRMTWDEAKKWCLEQGGELPDRLILFNCFMNETIKEMFIREWHWTSTEFDATEAWGQGFILGNQGHNSKNYSYYARAIRKVAI